MTPLRPKSPESLLFSRDTPLDTPDGSDSPRPSVLPKVLAILFPVLILLVAGIFFGARYWAHNAMQASLPQLDGSISIAGLSAPVTIQRDTHGVPHIKAASLDDLILAQGYVTAQDRLWQMETLRRHAAGELAEILGASMIPHDRTQRTLQLRTAAERALATLPPDQLHWLELYAKGVNASIATQRDHLPIEFRILQFTPAPWTPRDSILVYLVMFQDLTNHFPDKLAREAIAAHLPPELQADLYPIGSWRDHPPGQPQTDLTDPNVELPDIPLDESQSKLNTPKHTITPEALQTLRQSLASLDLTPACEGCLAGSNNWVVSGAHTASGKPLLSNDMHLAHGVPGIWYETDLQSPTPTGTPFHVTGVSLPGTPFVVVGHNDHIAWGFTNLGADVQDLLVERIRVTPTGSEFQTADGDWHPLIHQSEIIHVRRGKDVVLDVTSTQHDGIPSPIISGLYPPNGDTRRISLRWTIYDPANLTDPFLAVNSATDWASLCAAFSTWGGPAQNLVYADDQGHIAYHAIGRIPIRGSLLAPSQPSPVPIGALAPGSQWSGYIPFDQLPQVLDPPNGVLATANARITPDNYPFTITNDWSDPYRNERIWKVLIPSQHLTPADMLHLQTDVYSDVDHVIAQRLAYAIDHADSSKASNTHPTSDERRLRAAADILRNWNGNVESNAVAPAIVDAARAALWPMLLAPRLGNAWRLYTWGEKSYAEEQIIVHAPARWLPKPYTSWDNFLAAAVENGLIEAHAPSNLAKWTYGPLHPVDIENPLFSLSPIIPAIIGIPTGTGPQPQSGDTTTVKQVRRDFGPSERFTADLSNLDHSTLNVVLGQSGDPVSHWFMDQWPAWYHGTTFPLPYSSTAVQQVTTHTLTLTPQ